MNIFDLMFYGLGIWFFLVVVFWFYQVMTD